MSHALFGNGLFVSQFSPLNYFEGMARFWEDFFNPRPVQRPAPANLEGPADFEAAIALDFALAESPIEKKLWLQIVLAARMAKRRERRLHDQNGRIRTMAEQMDYWMVHYSRRLCILMQAQEQLPKKRQWINQLGNNRFDREQILKIIEHALHPTRHH